jgi:type IV pilus assembly protein PilE
MSEDLSELPNFGSFLPHLRLNQARKHLELNMRTSSRVSGFTLIELLIALAIVAILAGVAYPSYQNHVVKVRRTDVQNVLLQLENAMERYYSEQTPFTYVGAALGAGGIFPNQAPIDGATKYYDLSIVSATATSYRLRATPIVGTSQNGDGVIELQSNGTKWWDRDNLGLVAGTDDCWAKNC